MFIIPNGINRKSPEMPIKKGFEFKSKDISIAALNNSKECKGFLKIIFSKITFTKKSPYSIMCPTRVHLSLSRDSNTDF